MATLADIRNLDVVNPVVVLLEHPTLQTNYTTVASLVEPSYLGVPINTTWVVLDPNNAYYLKAIKLKGTAGPSVSTVPDVITNGGFRHSWIEEQLYLDIFKDPQFYLLDIGEGPAGPMGPPGPAGPAGPAGDQGPAPVVDYTYIISEILNQLNAGTTLSITGPALVTEGLTGQYSLTLTTSAGDTPVDGTITIQTPVTGASIDVNNLLSVANGSLLADTNLTLQATYTYLGQTYSATRIITLLNSVPVSLQASGLPALMNEGLSSQITVVATYNNGQTANVTANCTYGSSNGAALSVNSAGLTAAKQVSADTPVTVNITYVESSVVLTAALNTTVKNIVPVSLVVNGPTNVTEQTTANFTAVATFSDGSTQDVTSTTTFTMANATMGSFSAVTRGLFTAADVPSDTTGNVNAVYTASGTTVNQIKSITVLSNAVGIRPYYGVAPVTSTKDGIFIAGLPSRGASASLVGTVTMDSGAPGSGQTMFYAYPVAYGLAKFEDAGTPGFYGGWDGAQGDPTDPTKWGPITVNVDEGGTIVPFYLYQTDWDGLGSVTWLVSNA